MLYSNLENLLSYKEEDYQDSQNSNNNPLDNSFSLIFFQEGSLKNLFESSDILSINNSINKNIEGDKECSPAPAPLRSSPNQNQNQNQNELSSSHNMECPEVVNKYINNNAQFNDKTIEMPRLFSDDEYTINNEEDLIDKPFDSSKLYLESENIALTINGIENSELENKSAAINVIPTNENLNSQSDKLKNINNLSNSNLSSNFQELPCPNNNNFVSTPSDNDDRKNIKKVLFYSTKERLKAINQKGIIRKLKPDSLRKKIKARFHKKIKQIINSKLKELGSKLYFDSFPQSFITNINIEFNKPLLNKTMRELFQKSFGFKAKDREKINYNKKVIEYLERNTTINNDNFISTFLDSTYEKIIQTYMEGKFLLEDIEKLEKEGENSDYINRYTFIANNWIKFYKQGYI